MILKIDSMNKGVSILTDPAAIADGYVADCVGFDMVPEGRLETAKGISYGDLTPYLPTEDIQWADIYYIGTTRYVMATTATGFWVNGTKINSFFTGRFKGAPMGVNVYLVNGTYAIRFDGQATYNWGIAYPTQNPILSPGTAAKSTLGGEYYFLYTFIRQDAYGGVIHESSPTRIQNAVQYIGPITFNGEGIYYSGRPLSSDPQVTGARLYAVGGSFSDYWLIYTWNDNVTTSGELQNIGTGIEILRSWYNYPAPPGQDVAMYYNKIWMVGIAGHLNQLATSDILSDGTLAPEGFPPRNYYELDGNNGSLLNIDILGGKLSVKGEFGEWQVSTTDATDYLQTRSSRISPYGLASQDALVRMTTSHIYPSKRGFVETTGSTASFVFPELTPLIDSHISQSLGTSAGLVNYFTYNTSTFGPRTAKIDTYSGSKRFNNINDILFDQLFYDAKTGVAYGLSNGSVVSLEVGYENVFSPYSTFQGYIRSKTFQYTKPVVWQWVNFQHNTNDTWYELHVYVDDVLRGTFPFTSNSRTNQYFRFPLSQGTAFYFVIATDYRRVGEIYLPIRICHSGK